MVFLSVSTFRMTRDETRIIEGGSPAHPAWKSFVRFLLEESAWLLAAFAVTALAAQGLAAAGRPSAAPAVALFGLHGLVGIHVLRNDRLSLPDWLRVRRADLLWGVAGGAVLLGFNVAYGWLLEWAGVTPPDIAAMLRTLLPAPALFFWAGGLAPVVEELYFRGRLLAAFDSRLGPAGAGVLTSLAFAAIHGIPAFLPAYLVFAAVLLALRRRTGGLVAPIVAHMINNTFALL
jgi:membrane protease YdiL (CAAX protease family)